jgi:beta-fructofuranosidase
MTGGSVSTLLHRSLLLSLSAMAVLFCLLAFVLIFHEPAAASMNVETTVPTGTPVAGNYDGPLRPQVHFSPPKGFMNDPNGMFVDVDGIYHLYYQCMYSSRSLVSGKQF